jgi:hypothetical protein
MPLDGGVRMEVRHEHVTTGDTYTAEFSISGQWIAKIA